MRSTSTDEMEDLRKQDYAEVGGGTRSGAGTGS